MLMIDYCIVLLLAVQADTDGYLSTAPSVLFALRVVASEPTHDGRILGANTSVLVIVVVECER